MVTKVQSAVAQTLSSWANNHCIRNVVAGGGSAGLQRLCRNPYWFAGVEGITQNSAPNGAEELSPARRGGLGEVGNVT